MGCMAEYESDRERKKKKKKKGFLKKEVKGMQKMNAKTVEAAKIRRKKKNLRKRIEPASLWGEGAKIKRSVKGEGKKKKIDISA